MGGVFNFLDFLLETAVYGGEFGEMPASSESLTLSLKFSQLFVRGDFFCCQGADLFVELQVAFLVFRYSLFALLGPFFVFCALFSDDLFFAFRFILFVCFTFLLLILTFQVFRVFLVRRIARSCSSLSLRSVS